MDKILISCEFRCGGLLEWRGQRKIVRLKHHSSLSFLLPFFD